MIIQMFVFTGVHIYIFNYKSKIGLAWLNTVCDTIYYILIYYQVCYVCNFTDPTILIFMHVFLYRVKCPAAEAEGLNSGYHPQHQCREAAQPGRSYQSWCLGLEEAASLLHGTRQMLLHTYGGCTIHLYIWIPGVFACS